MYYSVQLINLPITIVTVVKCRCIKINSKLLELLLFVVYQYDI